MEIIYHQRTDEDPYRTPSNHTPNPRKRPLMLLRLALMFIFPGLLAAPFVSTAQTANVFTVKGQVFNSAEPPIPIAGATIKTTHTNNTSISDANGNFEIATRIGDTLTVSYVGYILRETAVTGTNNVIVTLTEDLSMLEQVVVTGYSRQKVKNLASSIAVVNSRNIENKPITQLSQALQGGVTGISVAQGSGLPGGDAATLKIRGVNTLGNTSPLVLVDGVPFDINAVDPVTVESITVLKDAAAASVYGARAANGVILITTKRGVAGAVKVNYDAYAGTQQPQYIPEFADAATFMQVVNEANANVGRDPQYTAEEIAVTAAGSDPLRYPNTDWTKMIISDNALITNHTLGISGGNSLARFAVTGTYLKQDGIIQNTSFNRFLVRANTSVSLRDNITMNLDFNATRSDQQLPYADGRGNVDWILYMTYGIAPNVAGKFPLRDDGLQAYGNYGEMRNPLAHIEQGGIQNNISDIIQVNFQPTWEIIPGLNVKMQYNYRVASSTARTQRDAFNFINYFTNQLIYTFDTRTGSSSSRSTYNYLSLTVDYEKNIGDHRLFLLGGASQEYDSPNAINVATLRSAFSKVYYTYNEKYLLEASLRGDGSSRFGPGKKWGVFPSVAVGWNISSEDFLKNSTWLSNWKLRASYGLLGNNQNVGNYRYQTTINPGNGSEQVIGNPNITWETVKMVDIGTDLSLLGNKVSLTIDWYDKITDNILLQPPVSQASALLPTDINAGVVRNRGWEFAFDANHDFSDSFNLYARTGLSAYKNTILELPGGPYYPGNTIHRVGQPLGMYYGLISQGLLQEADIAANVVRPDGSVAGDINYLDLNGDQRIDNDDRDIIGNPEPRVNYFVNLGFRYRNFDFEAQLNGYGSHTAVYTARIAAPLDVADPGAKPMLFQLDYWTPTNTGARFPRIVPNSLTSANVTRFSNFWFENAAYARIRFIQVGYSLSEKVVQRIGLKGLRLYVNTQNPFTFTKMQFLDPESKGNEQTYPLMKLHTFGLSARF